MRVLVTAASKHGATSEIGTLIAGWLTDAGIEAEARAPDDVQSLDGYDAVVLGSAVYAGRWLEPAKTFVERLGPELVSRPVWLFSSGPAGDPPKPEGEPVDVAPIRKATRARDHRVFAGKIDRHGLGLGEKLIVAAVRAPDGDFRPLTDIAQWTGQIAASLRQPVGVGPA
jgi:menaquinone-dependent protoporphyrinogen oxidase